MCWPDSAATSPRATSSAGRSPPPELEAWIADASQSWLDIAEKSRVDDALQERIRRRGARLTAEEEFIARKQAEASLHASEERNRLALQAAGMGTWDADMIGDVHSLVG